MRQAGAGRIVNASSVAAAAHPVSGLLLRCQGGGETTPWRWLTSCGPTASRCAVQPGDITRASPPHGKKTIDGDDVYGRPHQPLRGPDGARRADGHGSGQGGAFIAKVAMKQRVKPIYTIRFDYRFLALLTRILPYRFLNWLIGVIYGK